MTAKHSPLASCNKTTQNSAAGFRIRSKRRRFWLSQVSFKACEGLSPEYIADPLTFLGHKSWFLGQVGSWRFLNQTSKLKVTSPVCPGLLSCRMTFRRRFWKHIHSHSTMYFYWFYVHIILSLVEFDLSFPQQKSNFQGNIRANWRWNALNIKTDDL